MSQNPIVIIGGGPAGLAAAKGLMDLGLSSVVVEKQAVLGGTPVHAQYAALTPDMRSAPEAMKEMVDAVSGNSLVDIRTETVVSGCSGAAPNLELTLKGPKGEEKLAASAAIICTGFEHFDPGRENQMYGYYTHEDVITLVDAERMFTAGKFVRPSDGKAPERVAFIQCVGSRDRRIGNEWCSKVCCGIACKQSIEIRHLQPDAQVFVFYIDLRAYGFWENEIYWKAQEEERVSFIRGIVTEVTKRGDKLVVKGEDTTMGRPVEVEMDMVVLSVGMEPSAGTVEMSKIFDIPLESHGFLATTGGCLDTVSTTRPGVFVAGAATGPADLEDSVSAAGLAVVKAAGFVLAQSKKAS